MKEKFLELIEDVKKTGIVEALRNTTNAEEFKAAEQKFLDENQELCKRIKEWADEFKEARSGSLFAEGETIENPMEVVCVIRIINASYASEDNICEDYEDLIDAVRDIGDDFSVAVADCAVDDYFCVITAEDIFAAKDSCKKEDEAESDEDDSDSSAVDVDDEKT